MSLEGASVGPGVWGGAPGELVHLDAVDVRGRPLAITGRVIAGCLARLELTYPVRTAVHYRGAEPDWEATRKDLHDAIVREWFAMSVHDLLYGLPSEPGRTPLAFRFEWGTVRSLHIGERAWIEVVYVGEGA